MKQSKFTDSQILAVLMTWQGIFGPCLSKGQETWTMAKQRYTTREIIHKHLEADVLIKQCRCHYN